MKSDKIVGIFHFDDHTDNFRRKPINLEKNTLK